MTPNSKFISILSWLTFFFLLYCTFLYYSVGDKPWIFYNADSVYLPYLYQDLFLKNGSLSNWIFSPTPYFFPDMLIYFLIVFIVSNLKLGILLFAAIQLILYYYLILSIGSKIIKDKSDLFLFHISVLISLLLLATGHFQQGSLDMSLTSQAHFGTALMFLLATNLVLKTFLSSNKLNYIFLFLVCLLTGFSDLLFLTQFSAPAIFSLLVICAIQTNPFIRLTCIKNISAIGLGSMLSYIIYRCHFFYLNMDVYVKLFQRNQLDTIILGMKKIFFNLILFYYDNPLIVILFFGFLIGFILFFPSIKRQNESFLFVSFILFFSIVFGFFSLLLLDNNLMVDDFYSLRHSIPYIIFPAFLGVPLYLAQIKSIKKWNSYASVTIIIMIFLIAFFTKSDGKISNILNFYPKSTACLDSFSEKYQLKNGMTDYYWEGKSNNFLSKKNLNIVTLKKTPSKKLVPRFYFNTIQDYKKKHFNFLLINIDHQVDTENYKATTKENIIKQYGKPLFTAYCPSWNDKQNIIYVYPNGVLNKGWNF